MKGRPVIGRPHWDGAVSLIGVPLRDRLRETVLATGWLNPEELVEPASFKAGDLVSLPLEVGVELVGRVELVQAGKRQVVSGKLTHGIGTFVISRDEDMAASGRILLPTQRVAYQLFQQGDKVLVAKRPYGDVLCEGMPKEPGPEPDRSALRGPQAAVTVPALDSLPSATGVVYLDFDGETVTDPDWNGGATIVAEPAVFGSGSPITEMQIADVWARVAEDLKPFKVSVTTIRSRYDNAPVGNRMRCIITPTNTAAPSAGGVAFLRSYRARFGGSFSDDIPCWCFNDSNAAVMAMTISHEVGHTLDLRHDGTSSLTYYGGHGSGATGWGPLMGAPFSKRVVQWSIGDYPDANNTEDDLDIIQEVLEEANGVGTAYQPDEAGGNVATAAALGIMAAIDKSGIISSAADNDYFMFKTAGGTISISAQLAGEPNLDVRMRIVNASNVTVATAPVLNTSLGATISHSLAAGTYYVVVSCGGRAANGSDHGYSTYGSIGAYRLTGTYVPLPEIPLITEDPAPMSVIRHGQALSLLPRVLSNTPVSYQWKKAGVNLAGKTSSTLTFNPVQPGNAGDYTVVVRNSAGSAESRTATVVVEYKPVFTTSPPAATQTVATGTAVTLSVATNGTNPITYQWRKNNVDITGNPSALTPSLQLTGLDWFDSASYTCVASNGIGSTTSSAAKLVVTSGPLFTVQPPTTKAVAVGATLSVSAKAVGTGAIKYQWFKGTTPVPGATSATLKLNNASEAVHESDTYFVRATNGLGSTDSDPLQVDVQIPPAIAVPPQTTFNLAAGAPLILSVSASGTPILAYQWYQNNLPIPGANADTLDLTPLFWTQRGAYKCIVSNAVGKATSKTFTVNLTSPAVILTQPTNTKIARGGSGTLRVVAGGTPTIKYQWFKNGAPVPKATGTSLVLSKVSDATVGNYTVQVSNTLNVVPVMSDVARVEVENAPRIVTHPVTAYAPVGGVATFSVLADPLTSPVIRYQWYKGKLALAGETNSMLTLSGLSTANNGSYSVVVTNDVGKVTSRAATLYVQNPPAITVEPLDQTKYEYDTVTFSVTATGSATLKYSWHFNGGPAIAGATGRTLTLTKVRPDAAGNYTCIASNKVGFATSRAALLTVDPVPSPTFTSFQPSKGVAGDRVRIRGTNLNWTTSVKLGSAACAFTKISATELLITVPAGAKTGTLSVTTYGGTVLSSSSFVVTSVAPNDMFADAKLLFGSSVTAVGNSTGSTVEPLEPNRIAGKSIWYRWRCPATGTFKIDARETRFDHYCTFYSGTSLSSLSSMGYSYRYHNGPGFYYYVGSFEVSVIKGQDYYIQFEGVDFDPGEDTEGPVKFSISPVAAFPQDPAAVTAADGTEMRFPLPAMMSEGGGDKAVLTSRFEPLAGNDGAFAWMAYDQSGEPLFALNFDVSSGSISYQGADGSQMEAGQALVPGQTCDLEVHLDFALHTLGVLLNGHWIVENAVLPETVSAGNLADFSLISLPSASGLPAARLQDSVHVGATTLGSP